MRILSPSASAVWVWALGPVLSLPAQAQDVRYVDAACPSGVNDGLSWSEAYLELQDALDDASTNGAVTEIRVAGGVYRPDGGTGDPLNTFTLLNNLTLRGGFAGNSGANPGLRDWAAYPTVLSGDLAGDDDTVGNSENSFHVVDANGVDSTAVLDGFVIRGGNADGAAPHHSGGGVYNAGGRPTLTHCTFESNSALQDGGAVLNSGPGAAPVLIDCTFLSNHAVGRGGAVFNNSAGSTVGVSFSGCVFRDNDAADGGGVYNLGGRAVFSSCRWESNVAVANGGAVYNFTTETSFSACTFDANVAARGGAMRNSSSRPALARCVFTANTATDDGGAMMNQNAGPTLAGCVFVGNSAGDEGGALWSFNTLAFAVRNCTFSGNAAGDAGGALYNWGTTGGGSSPQLSSCVLWGNSDGGGSDESGQMHTERGAPAVSYSCVQGWTGGLGGAGNLGRDPRLAADGIHLRPLSVCIDRGDPTFVSLPGEVDLDGQPRVRSRVDMGADEYAPLSSGGASGAHPVDF